VILCRVYLQADISGKSRVKIKRFFTHKPDDPMGALNDLAFLLIIYFLVIAGFNTNMGFLLNLPAKNEPRIVQTEDLLRLTLAEGGNLMYREEALTSDNLDLILKENLKVHPNMTVQLSIDQSVPYQRFVDIIHIIRCREVENFSFTMKDGPQ